MLTKYVGVLTAGGDTPGLNAAIRGIGKAVLNHYNMQIIGFRDGFRGLVQDRFIPLDKNNLAGILTVGGTILGTSRDKPHRMKVGHKIMDMTDVIVTNYEKHHLDCLICIGGGGTQKNANRLREQGLNIITLPKTIDNDVAKTDITFGFHTALSIATEAVDRLHSTAHSHHRIIVLEIMGHRAGWLALGAGVSGGADVILIPEIPYDINVVAKAIKKRSRSGRNFSIIAVAEGAMSKQDWTIVYEIEQEKKNATNKEDKKRANAKLDTIYHERKGHTLRLAKELEKLTNLESRLTILGHLQRGGAPSAYDRLLATSLGTACAYLIHQEKYGVMVSVRGEGTEPVPLEAVAGQKKLVPLDHPWVLSARRVGTCLGDSV